MLKSLALFGALGLALLCIGGPASAMPVDKSLAVQSGVQPENVRLVCNRWGRCWHVGGWGYGPRWRHRHWRRW